MVLFIIGIITFIVGLLASTVARNKVLLLCSVAGLLAVVVSFVSFIPTGHTGIMTTFGRVHDTTYEAGLIWKAPWNSVIKMDNREQRVDFSLQAFSKDIQEVEVNGSLNFNIDKTTAMNLYRDVGTNYVDIFVQPRIKEDVKIIIAQYTAEALIENRQAASDSIYELIQEELLPKGINVISLALEGVDFSDVFTQKVEEKQVATQEKQRAQTEQERKTMEEQAAAERAIIAEKAQAERAVIAAKADLEVVQIQAEAALFAGERQAEMNKRIAESLTPELIKYFWIESWNGQLPTVSTDSSMSLINVNDILTENTTD